MQQLPPGFRFRPTPEILINFYLHKKIFQEELPVPEVILNKDLYGSNSISPWELLQGSSEELYCFTLVKKKYGGKNIDRVTKDGSWKMEKPKPVKDDSNNKVIGYLTTLTFKLDQNKFEENHIAKQWKWIMHEYSLKDANCGNEYWVVCGIKRGSRICGNKESSQPTSLKRSFHEMYDHVDEACNEGEFASTSYDENSELWMIDDASMPTSNPVALMLQIDDCPETQEVEATNCAADMIDASMPTSNLDTLDDEYSDIDLEALLLQIDDFPETQEGEATNCAADMSTTERTSMYAGDSGMQLGYDDLSAGLTAEVDYSYFSPLLAV
ncbi:Nac domain-containing protein 83-like isoform x2 [Thalictrum thalictroides]|uniref:Nac domain-containing protein 83-like isoform x2 n=1 Tax=Thalictrum thalictroides TaxID=46969 RepID=A0A7J6X0C2_THATH|nr:Nac domain-containing protein 83-like isoform x2 [Thalictrum thalictroides]